MTSRPLSALEKAHRGKAAAQDDLRFDDWLVLSAGPLEAISALINAAERRAPERWRWPDMLAPVPRALCVTSFVIGAYQSSGWAIGVMESGFGILPHMPEALRAHGEAYAAHAVETCTAKLLAFGYVQGEETVMYDALAALENMPGYNDLLTEIETGLPAPWNAMGLPSYLSDAARTMGSIKVWEMPG